MTLGEQMLEAHRRACGDHDISAGRCPVWIGMQAAASLGAADAYERVAVAAAQYPEGAAAIAISTAIRALKSSATRGGEGA